MKKTILIISLLFLCVFAYANFAFADRGLELDYPIISGGETLDDATSLPEFIKYIFNFIITIGGILAFGILIYSAIRLFLSAGNPQEISEAKNHIISAIMGLAILFGSYTILTIINPDLRILHISELNPFEETESDPSEHKDLKTKYYQEIPVGFLTENLLAKNINCFDEESNLVNCYNREIILGYAEVLGVEGKESKINYFDPTKPNEPHPSFCYDYDNNGDMKDDDGNGIVDLLTDHDRLDCIQKLSQAIQIKNDTIKINSDIIKTETDECECSPCGPGSCGCEWSSCQCTTGDPCLTRDIINTSRNIIYEIVNGDAANVPTFLDLREARARMIGLKQELQRDLKYLKGAEKITTQNSGEDYPNIVSPYGQRISLAEYQEKKSYEKINKIEYESFNISEYCRNFHCAEFDPLNPNVCIEYGLNDGKLCETYNLDGDGATLYFPISP